MRILLFYIMLSSLLLSSVDAWAQRARRTVRVLPRQKFAEPVMVWLRLNEPVPRAEYCLVMEKALVGQLDTLTFRGMLHHPGIYFSKVYHSSVPGWPARKYDMTTPETQDGNYPFGSSLHPFASLERPPRGRLYMRKEFAEAYSHWQARQNASDSGYDGQLNTLPGVDSVRVVYIIRMRERWKRKPHAPH